MHTYVTYMDIVALYGCISSRQVDRIVILAVITYLGRAAYHKFDVSCMELPQAIMTHSQV